MRALLFYFLFSHTRTSVFSMTLTHELLKKHVSFCFFVFPPHAFLFPHQNLYTESINKTINTVKNTNTKTSKNYKHKLTFSPQHQELMVTTTSWNEAKKKIIIQTQTQTQWHHEHKENKNFKCIKIFMLTMWRYILAFPCQDEIKTK